ncbi:MAG TPA: agmatine deiminase family protein, partial [Myxococcota bacterium]|nr:agmatine deiminase family protein [Myxococcota bacterium]
MPAAQYRRLAWPYDSVWSRDYGPVGIDEASHTLGIVDPTYRHYASRPDDDDIPCRVAVEAGAACHTTTLILDGGNYMTDGRGSVFLTRRIYDWNSQLSEAQVNQLLRDYLGAQSLHVFDYAVDEYGDPADGTGHIDMFAKLLPGCVVLVVDTDDAPFAAVCDAAAATFAGLECVPGQNYQVLRVPGWYQSDGWWGVWYTYTNSLIINDTVLVPSYSGGQDAAARAVYQQALPGYTVALLNTDEPILSGGSIHCITKEIPFIEDLGCATPADCDLPQVDQHACTAGVCGIVSCDPGYGDCDGAADDGCEQDLWQVAACGTSCARLVNCPSELQHAAGEGCAAGACDYASCDAGYGDCDGEREDGCEANLWQPGACGTTCAQRVDCAALVQHATGLACAAGACDYGACAALYGDCDGDRTNGCELDLRLDEAHCGGCLTSCADGEVCEGGLCEVPACPAGLADCDGQPGDGCEVQLGTDADCAGCGDDCRDRFAHATGACVQGACALGPCAAGYGDCDGSAADGCESEHATDEAHCGDCQTACAAGQTCEGGLCRDEPCPAGLEDCDGQPGNGCEVQLGTDADCAGCGDDCRGLFPHGQGACLAGACALSACEPGFADCDLEPASGCERSLAEAGTCGACNRACAAGESCVRSGASWTCQGGCADGDG